MHKNNDAYLHLFYSPISNSWQFAREYKIFHGGYTPKMDYLISRSPIMNYGRNAFKGKVDARILNMASWTKEESLICYISLALSSAVTGQAMSAEIVHHLSIPDTATTVRRPIKAAVPQQEHLSAATNLPRWRLSMPSACLFQSPYRRLTRASPIQRARADCWQFVKQSTKPEIAQQ